MAKIDYDDFTELFDDLEEDIVNSMKDGVDKKVKSIYKTKVEQSYREYTPRTNRSRFRKGLSGSFAEEENFKEEITREGDSIVYTLENHRETDCDCEYCRGERIYLAPLIEDGYAGKNRIKAKLVYEKTQEEIDKSIEDIIANELLKKDW